ncbi:hypothetical protein Tco_0299779 [Tanacetum coccineum]
MLLFIGYCSSEHYSSKTLFTSRNCCSREGMEAKSFEEGLAEVIETLKRLQSTLLLYKSKLEESFRRTRQDISLASEKFHTTSEKFHRSIIAAIKEEKNQEGQVPSFRVQLNQQGHKSMMKAKLL